MNKSFKIYIFIAAIGAHITSFGMLTAYKTMPDSYKKGIEKKQSTPFSERKLDQGAKLAFEQLNIASKKEEESRKRIEYKMPTLPREVLLRIASYNSSVAVRDDFSFDDENYYMALNMRATCKDFAANYVIRKAQVDINEAQCFLRDCHDPAWLSFELVGWAWKVDNALKYVLISDDPQYLKHLFDINEKEINQYCSKDIQCYLFYKDTIKKALKYKSNKCLEWIIKEDPLKVNNHLVHDIVDCYKSEECILRWKAVGGLILDDLWSLFPKDKHGIVNFVEYSQLEEFCEKNGCKSREEIVDAYEKRKANSVTSVLQLPELVKAIQKQTYSFGTRSVKSGWYRCTGDELDVLNMRLTCKDMNNAVTVPPLEEAKPYLTGKILLGQRGKYCIRPLKLAIARNETESLCEILNKNMDAYEDESNKYNLYRKLITYAIEKDSNKSFESLIKNFDYLNNYQSSDELNAYGNLESFGPIINDINKMQSIPIKKKAQLLVFCKKNGCLTLDEIKKNNSQSWLSQYCTLF